MHAAMDAAARVLEALPDDAVWSFMVTNEDDRFNPAVLNVWVEDEDARVRMRDRLRLGKPTDEADSFETHLVHPLLNVSILEKENING